jgi:hypothetical protein
MIACSPTRSKTKFNGATRYRGISKRAGPSAGNLFFRSSWSKTGLRYVGSGFTVAQGYCVAVANWGGVCSGIARDVDNIY